MDVLYSLYMRETRGKTRGVCRKIEGLLKMTCANARICKDRELEDVL